MIRNYLKTALRSLSRNKRHTFINVIGLTVGLTACFLLATVVLNDLSYDRQWSRGKDIFRITGTSKTLKTEQFTKTFSWLGPELQKNFPEVEAYCRMDVARMRLDFNETAQGVAVNCLTADTSVFRLLDLQVMAGTPERYLPGSANLVLTASLARQFFPKGNPLGKTIRDVPEIGAHKSYVITGIIRDLPVNSHFYAQALVVNTPFDHENDFFKAGEGSLLSQYLLLRPGTDREAFDRKMNGWYRKITGNGDPFGFVFNLQPLREIHLNPIEADDVESGSSIRNVYIFSGVALLLLLIACFNFVNLTSALALKRLGEIGIRKVLGAAVRQLVVQFLHESLVYFLISFGLAALLYRLFLAPLEHFVGHPLELTFLSHLGLFLAALGITLLVCLFTGIYPALILSRQSVISTLKGYRAGPADTGSLRKGLITVQFTIAISLTAIMIIVFGQLYYINHKDLGFDKENLLSIGLNTWGKEGGTFKQELLKMPGVEHASLSVWTPSKGGGYMTGMIADPQDTSRKLKAWYISGDKDLVATLGLRLLRGRSFDPDLSTDALDEDSLMHQGFDVLESAQKSQPILVTAYTAKLLGIRKLGEPVKGVMGIPIGIVKDFNNESLREQLKPCIISADKNPDFGSMLVRINPVASAQVLKGIHRLWQRFYPDRALQYNWVSDQLAHQYDDEGRLERIFIFFSLLSIFLACLGLFGLVAFTAEQRTKEIGIRKVLGASPSGIVALLSADFLKLVLLAFVLATPMSWWGMNRWLEHFAYRIHLSWWMFGIAGVLTLLISLGTVCIQAVHAALANPVKALHDD